MADLESIPIFVVEDSVPTLRAIGKLLSAQPSVRLVGTAASGEEALAQLEKAAPRVILMDLELPGRSGVQTTRELKARGIRAEVLVLTSFEDEDHVFEAMRAGASGYVVKGASAQKLISAIEEVDAGGTVIEPRLAKRFWQFFKGVQAPPQKTEILTALEKEILFVIAKGLSNAEVGGVVNLDRRTVRTHLGHIYQKLGVTGHVAAVVEALRRGLVEL